MLNDKNMSFDINKNQDLGRKSRFEEKPNQRKGVQFHECEGYGHIKIECATVVPQNLPSHVFQDLIFPGWLQTLA